MIALRLTAVLMAAAMALPAFAQAQTKALAPAETPAARQIDNPQWTSQPQPGDFAWAYPPEALKDHIDGQVLLDCEVNAAGRLQDCVSDIEIPEDRGFGAAARNLAGLYVMAPTLEDGSSAQGARVKAPFAFNWQGREASTEIQGGAPVARAQAEASPFSSAELVAILVGLGLFVLTSTLILIFDARRRDRSLRLGAWLRDSVRFVPGHLRRAPGPLALALALSTLGFVIEQSDPGAGRIANLLAAIGAFFLTTSGLRIAYRDFGGRFAPSRSGFRFGEVEGKVWISNVVAGVGGALMALVVLALVAGGGAALKMSSVPEPTLYLVAGACAGVLAPLLIALVLRATLLAPVSVAASTLDIGGAWRAGRGRLGALLLAQLGAVMVLLLVQIIANMIPPSGMWLAGLMVGVSEAAYYSFNVASLAKLTLMVSPPRRPELSPLGVLLD